MQGLAVNWTPEREQKVNDFIAKYQRLGEKPMSKTQAVVLMCQTVFKSQMTNKDLLVIKHRLLEHVKDQENLIEYLNQQNQFNQQQIDRILTESVILDDD